ncbi:MAG: class I poly(R)-hydroxyalkanoic acid synthase, partial [Comamonas sp.]|nr:class I poly(R)-hydroxyalkanoic acid synthase [Candidatus Comamonas equi]
MSTESPWGQSAEQFQQFFADQWGKAISSFSSFQAPGALPEAPAVQFEAQKLQAIQQAYVQDAAKLWSSGLGQAPGLQDRRFAGEGWMENPLASFTAAAYLLNARALTGMADAVQADDKTRQRIRFAVEQWVAAMSPSNFLALNAQAQRKAIETKGESLAKGIQNLLHDLGQGHVSMTDESVFEVGKNVATTEGAIVFENELFQLIEYKPLTAKVHERPFLLVPPCINKYYILDLQPENS